MTVSTSSSSVTYQGNGATTVFPYAFLIPVASDVVVSLTDTTQTPNVVQTLTTAQYSITGLGSSGGGNVTLAADPLTGLPLANGHAITIARSVPITQPTSLTNQGALWPSVVEGAIDNVVMQCQQLAAALAQAVTAPVGTSPANYLAGMAAQASAASASATAAGTSATNAATSATNAATSATAAAASASAAASYVTPNAATYVNGIGFIAGTSTTLTLPATVPAAACIVTFDGITQHHDGYSVSGTTMTFSSAIPNGVAEVEVTFGTRSGNSLGWSAISNTPTTLAGYGIADPIALTSGAYANPAWITSLGWTKLTGTPTSLAGYGIADPVALTSGSYSNPAWITGLAWSKLTGTPTSAAGYGITNGSVIDGWGAKTAPAGTVVGTTDTQTLTNKTLGSTTLADGGVLSASSNILQANVGVATTPSAWSGGGVSGVIEFANGCSIFQGSGGLSIMQNEYYNGTNWIRKTANLCSSIILQNGVFYFQTAATGGAGSTVSQATVCQIANNGNVTNSNNSYGAISDPKLKQDIVLSESQWADVKALSQNVVKYHLKSDPTGPLQLGFVSADVGDIKGVRSISPGLVQTSDDLERVVTPAIPAVLDAEGNVVTEEVPELVNLVPTGTTTDHVQYSLAYMKAFKALGEAMLRIEALEATLADLQAKIGA